MPTTATITTELLMRFCGEERVRYSTPWFSGGYIYAVNGHIAIRLDVSVHNPQYEMHTDTIKRPNVDSVLAPSEKVTNWHPYPVFAKCISCGGLGKTRGKCSTCDGEGDHECPCCDEMHECGHCDGTGERVVECGCNERVGNRLLKGRYAHLIGDLPAPEWGTVSDKTDDMIFFRGPGYLGCVMPLSQESV